MSDDTPADEFRRKLIGAWTLVSYEARGADEDDTVFPLEREPAGLIIYTPDGFMSAQLMLRDRPRYADDDQHSASDKEFATAASGYIGYAGSYEVLDDGHTVVHRATVSLMPNLVGVGQYRVVRFQNDRIELSPREPLMLQGKLRNARLTWQRA